MRGSTAKASQATGHSTSRLERRDAGLERIRRRRRAALEAALCAALALSAWGALAAPSAGAAPPERWVACNSAALQAEDGSPVPPAAEGLRCDIPRGLDADPDTGHVFLADQNNYRVVDLSAHGQLAKAWGWDVVASGPGETAADELEVCVPSDGDECKPGVKGSGIGQFNGVHGVAVDSAGNVYVNDRNNHRVQKFTVKGEPLWMIGGEVNETSGGNLCPRPGFPADVCKAAPAASGGGAGGEFGASWAIGDFIAVDLNGTESEADDTLYVGDEERIQLFDADGNYLEDLPDPEGNLTGATVQSLALDSDGFLYVIYKGKADVRKVDPATGKELLRFELTDPNGSVVNPTAVAVDAEGSVYAFGPISFQAGRPMDPIFKFDPAGNEVDNFGIGQYDGSTGLATNLCEGNEAPGNLYVANIAVFVTPHFVRAYGTPPTNCGQAVTGPASSITETTATLNGKVNPKGEAVTECVFEYGLTTTYGSEAPCAESAGEIGAGEELVEVHADIAGLEVGTVYHFRLSMATAGAGEAGSDETFKTLGPPTISGAHTVGTTFTEARLEALVNPEGLATSCLVQYGPSEAYGQSTAAVAVGSDRSEHAVGVLLEGLAPGQTYHWRYRCENASGPTTGPDRTATTFAPGAGGDECPNRELRSGASALLPDCRAYEMVSPVDKNGGDIFVGGMPFDDDPGAYIQSSPDGNRLAYSTQGVTFGDQPAGFSFNQYLGERGAGGWETRGIHPPVTGTPVDAALFGQVREFMAFTPELCSAWLVDFQTPPLSEDAQAGYRNLYRQDNCGPGAGELEALTTAPAPLPQGTGEDYVGQYSVQGISEDGVHAAFVAEAPLVQDCRTSVSADEVTYRWLRDGVPIAGASEPTYRPVAADAGTALQCQVLAVSANAGSTQASNPVSVIPPEAGVTIAPPVAPNAIFPPAQSATLTVGGPGGQTLTCNPLAAEWQGSPTFSYRWYRNGEQIAGAEAAAYAVSEADLAAPAAFQCAVTGANGDGAVTKASINRLTSPAPSGPAAPSVDAENGGTFGRVFDRSGGANYLVSLLPNGRPAGASSEVGSGWRHNLHYAVSEDGSRVFFTTGIDLNGKGRILQRRHPERAEDCEDPAKACTTQVGGSGLASAFFWQATPDGTKALFGELTLDGDSLFVFSEGEPRRRVAEDVEGVAAASEDLGRIYFLSRDAIEGAGQNSEGEEAQPGENNLYLDEGGAVSFIATLTEGDAGAIEEGFLANAYDVGATAGARRPTRTTPDGSHLVFQARAPLTGFDNETAAGKPAVEVFAYEAAGGELSCISCNPSGARPQARELLQPYRKYAGAAGNPTGVVAAAWIPTWEHPLHASNVLSADGGRIFFNSNDALLPRDTNGAQDVYEWEAAGSGGCEAGDPDHFPQNGGCLYLISSGKSPFESELWEASPDGDHVFFTTESSLLPQDPGLIDLYDAHVGGGFPQPEQRASCEGEACQSPPAPPEFGTPASAAFAGPGDPKPGKGRKRCPKGKRKVRRGGEARCVKRAQRKGAKQRRRAGAKRRAPR